ncbi:hypothetical protein GCM10010524_01830 [Streptomyces mexicanus]
MQGAAGGADKTSGRVPYQRRIEEVADLPVDAGRHRYSLPSGRVPFRPFDSATAGPIRSATPRYQSGHDGRRTRPHPPARAHARAESAFPEVYAPRAPAAQADGDRHGEEATGATKTAACRTDTARGDEKSRPPEGTGFVRGAKEN